jgi:hypothetical protein
MVPDSECPQAMPRTQLRGAVFAALGIALCAAQITVASYFLPTDVVLRDTPVSGADYDTHIQQCFRVLEGLQGWGKTWVYDPRLLAGHPNGVIFDADNKGWELTTFVLATLGLSRGAAFNGFIVIAQVLVVPVLLSAALLFGLRRGEALLAGLLAALLWLFDSYIHWLWFVGTLEYAFSAYFWLLPVALFHAYIERGSRWAAAGCALALGAALFLHPYSFFALLVPLAILHLRRRKQRGWSSDLITAGIVLVALSMNAIWLGESLAQFHYIRDSGYFGSAGVSQVVADFGSVVLDTAVTGVTPIRSALRWFCFACALAGLLELRRARDARFLPWAAALGVLLVLAYTGAYSRITAQVQPYRFVAPAMFLASMPAGMFLGRLQPRQLWRSLGLGARGVFAVLLLLGIKQLANDITLYFPALLPRVPALLDGRSAVLDATGYPPFARHHHDPDTPEAWELARFVERHDNGRGRFLVQNGFTGEQLAWKTDVEILGGFLPMNLEHSRANLFRRRLDEGKQRKVDRAAVRRYLEAYAVEWVVIDTPDAWFFAMPELFVRHSEVAGHRIMRTTVPISRFEENDGDVSARTNVITVRSTDPARDVVLRYHFHEALACRPDCRVEPSENPVSGVPFIRVRSPHPENFTIYNGYLRTAR